MRASVKAMPRTVVAMNDQGRITLPAQIRRALGLHQGSQLDVKVTDDVIELRRSAVIPEEDRWAYTPEAIASLKRALADVKAGRVFEMTEAQLRDYPKKHRPKRRR